MKFTPTLLSASIISVFLIACSPRASKDELSESGEDTVTQSADSEDARPSPLVVKNGDISGKNFKIQYGSPAAKDRVLWGDLVPYNVVWRTGANEASYVDLSSDMVVEGKNLAAGKYSLFTIPKENSTWTVIFNSEWNLEHGHFQYDEKNDVLRVEVMPIWEETSQDRLSMEIENPGLVIRWEKVRLPISIK
jgi:hypothetical protein